MQTGVKDHGEKKRELYNPLEKREKEDGKTNESTIRRKEAGGIEP